VYAGLTLATLGEWARRDSSRWSAALAGAAVVAAVVIPAGESVTFAVRNQNAEDLALMREQLRLACQGEAVLDGTALAVFRPAAYRQGVLIRGIREWVARGKLSEDAIAADILASRAPIAYRDQRIQGMIGSVAVLLERYYVPGPSGLLLAGAEVSASTQPGRVTVELLRPGSYRLTFPPHLTVALDAQVLAPGWHTLEARRYEITWWGQGGTIRLTAATCPERRSLGVPGA
jgi:hypothetical protein